MLAVGCASLFAVIAHWRVNVTMLLVPSRYIEPAIKHSHRDPSVLKFSFHIYLLPAGSMRLDLPHWLFPLLRNAGATHWQFGWPPLLTFQYRGSFRSPHGAARSRWGDPGQESG